VARLKFPAPATEETWVTSQHGDPVFMIVAEPSDSLAGELRRLLPGLLTWRTGPAPDRPPTSSPPSPAPMTAAGSTATT